MPAGDLRYRIGFYSRQAPGVSSPPEPDYGETEGDFAGTANFVVYGNIAPKLGGEQVLADRLTGVNFVNITVRQSSETRQVTTDWKAKDENTGDVYNIKSIVDPAGGNVRHGFLFEGVSQDHLLAELYAVARILQIADGPDEVHHMAIARRETWRYREAVAA